MADRWNHRFCSSDGIASPTSRCLSASLLLIGIQVHEGGVGSASELPSTHSRVPPPTPPPLPEPVPESASLAPRSPYISTGEKPVSCMLRFE